MKKPNKVTGADDLATYFLCRCSVQSLYPISIQLRLINELLKNINIISNFCQFVC